MPNSEREEDLKRIRENISKQHQKTNAEKLKARQKKMNELKKGH